MITITTLCSGSSGNCYIVESVSEGISYGKLIIEAGVRFETVQKALKFDLNGIAGVLVSHEHLDHAAYAKEYASHSVPVFATKGTLSVISSDNAYNFHALEYKKCYTVGKYRVMPFETQHDAAEPCGFIIDCPDGNKVLFATDTYYLKYRFPDVTVYMIECNYEESVLRCNIESGLVHPSVGERVRKSHMSLSQCLSTLKANNLSKTKAIILIHLSGDNSKPDLFRQKVEETTGKLVFVAKKGGTHTIF